MEFEDDAYVLSARVHGETGAIVELLTAHHGKWAAHVAGGASRRMKPFLQAGARTIVHYRARVSDQLGSAQLEPVGEGPAALFDDPMALAGLSAAAAVAAAALPEREPHPGAFLAFEALSSALLMPKDGRTLEDVVRELLRPLLKEWLDQNLPRIVEAKVEEEVHRIARGRG